MVLFTGLNIQIWGELSEVLLVEMPSVLSYRELYEKQGFGEERDGGVGTAVARMRCLADPAVSMSSWLCVSLG